MADPILKGNVLNTKVGPGWLLTGPDYDNLKCLGLTQDGITLSGELTTEEIEWDQIDDPLEYISKVNIKIETKLGEMTKENMGYVMLGGYVVYDPALEAEEEQEKDAGALFVMGSPSGKDPLDFAKILIIHPKKKPWADRSEDIVMEKAYPLTNLNMNWGKKDPRLLDVSFKAVVNTGPTGIERSFIMGDYAKIATLLDTEMP